MSEQAAQSGDFPGAETVTAPGMGTGKVSEVAGELVAPAASDYPALPADGRCAMSSEHRHPALVRGDDGNLHVRRFASACDAVAAARGRECAAPAAGMWVVEEAVPHPRGGWTAAVRMGRGSARVYAGWWPRRSAVPTFFAVEPSDAGGVR